MSIKTLRKRIALVAVAALGTGVLSVAQVNAAYITNNVTSISLARATTTPTVGSAVAVNIGAVIPSATRVVGDQTMFQAALTNSPAGGFVAISGALGTCGQATAGGTAGGCSAASYPTGWAGTAVAGAGTGKLEIVASATTAGSTVTASATAGFGSFTFTPTVAGTYTMTVWHDTTSSPDGVLGASEVRQSIDIVVAAAAVLSAGTSSAFIRGDNTATAADSTTDALPATATATAGTANSAAITISLKDSANAAMASGNTISATITGPGYISWSTADAPTASQCSATPTYSATLGRSVTAQSADAVGTLYVCADGNSGVSTITLTATNTASGLSITLPSKTVTFYGAVTRIVATGVMTVGRAGGFTVGVDTANRNSASVIPSVILKATDRNGVVVGGLTGGITCVSSNVTVMTSTCTNNPDTAGASNSSGGLGFYNIQTNTASSSKSGDKATLTFRVVDPAGDGTTFLTSTVDFTIGGSVATETLSFDKASYAPGEAMVVTRTAKDSAGNPVFDGAASPAITFSKAVGGTAPAAGIYIKGVSASSTSLATASVFAPVISGAFNAIATSGATGNPTITASSAVASPIDAQIASLVAAIAKLQKAINKIQKRLNR